MNKQSLENHKHLKKNANFILYPSSITDKLTARNSC